MCRAVSFSALVSGRQVWGLPKTLAASDDAAQTARAAHVMLARVLEQSGNLPHALQTFAGVSTDTTSGSTIGS